MSNVAQDTVYVDDSGNAVSQPQYNQPPQYGAGAQAAGAPQAYNTPAYTVPPVSTQPDAGKQASAGAFGQFTLSEMMQPHGWLRAAELIFAIISFGAAADQAGYSSYASYSSAFGFLVAAGVLTFLWALTMIVVYLFSLGSAIPMFPFIELGFDVTFCIFEFAAGIAAAVQCDNKFTVTIGGVVVSSVTVCSGADKMKAGIAFAFLTCFLLAGSVFFSYKRLRK